MPRTRTDWLVIHCSATRSIMDIGAAEIRAMHVNGRGWSDIGYHKIIRRNGIIENGRMPLDSIGAHVAGHNHNSIGICMVDGLATEAPWAPTGEEYTDAQWSSLKTLLTDLTKRYPRAKVCGHRDFPGVVKACPCFDAIPWAKVAGFPAAKPTAPGGSGRLG